MFNESTLFDESKIKVASIIKFALRYLVTVNPTEGRSSLYAFWEGDKSAFERKDEVALLDYITFCTKTVDALFSAVRDTFRESWNDSSTKILSVTSINGFIIAFNRQLKKNGINTAS